MVLFCFKCGSTDITKLSSNKEGDVFVCNHCNHRFLKKNIKGNGMGYEKSQ